MAEITKTKFKTKIFINLTFCGKKIRLAADFVEENGKESADKISQLNFYGGTMGLNLSITKILKDILAKLNLSESEIPQSLIPDIVLKDIFGYYSGKTKSVSFIALTTIAKQEVRFVLQYLTEKATDGKEKTRYLFGVLTEIGDLGGLPLVGEALKEMKMTNVGFIYASDEGEFCLPTLDNEPTEEEIKNDPFAQRKIIISDKTVKYGKGINITGNLQLSENKEAIPIVLPLKRSSPPAPSAAKASDNTLTSAEKVTENNTTSLAKSEAQDPFNPDAKWFNWNKKMGPVTISRVGFSYSKGIVKLLISGNIELAGLKLSLEGLGLGFNPSEIFKGNFKNLSFELSGLGLSYNKPPLRISGMFIKAQPQGDEIISFYGAAEIATSMFGISGIGAYAKLKGDKTSFFIYAMYNGPIGGPAFFFVTGIAAGFGFNRSIRLPKIQEVNEFPLVAMALNPDPKKTLNDILGDLVSKNWIPSSPGDYWLAVGIKFTSFKLLESFVLVTVQFGTRLEFAILGLTVLNWPGNGLPSIAYIELAVLARFSPDSGVISVEALLTHNSYLFDKNCKISGGFAFYVWVSGEHEGDFVISLGGYHPKYVVPAHYPQVDRLALNWKLSKVLSIRGEMYFALTPKCIMAGGKWEVYFDIGFLKASLVIWADMYIAWAPFKYEISAGIIVRIEACIKIWFVHISFKLQMGAQLYIWGPPFAGYVYVDWTIFSFTIPFGDKKKEALKPLSWDEFKSSFIPKKNSEETSRGLEKETNQENPINTKILSGIIGELKDADGNVLETFVNPYSLSLNVDSFFPIKYIYGNGNKEIAEAETLMNIAGQDIPTFMSKREKGFGVKSMGVKNLDSKLFFSIKMGGKELENIKFKAIANAKGVANALWANSDSDKEANVIKDVLSGLELHTVEETNAVIEIIQLDSYDLHCNKDIVIKRLSEADTIKDEGGIKKIISDSNNLNHNNKTKIKEELQTLGFDLWDIDKLVYDEIGISTPLYLAKIGQSIPPLQ